MTEKKEKIEKTESKYGDPITWPFWEAAARHELLIQCCADCGQYQFYPRAFCLNCQSDVVEWVRVAGTGIIYSLTTVRLQILPELEPPYVAAVVQLDEGPRLLTNIVDSASGQCKIGDRVHLAWRERSDAPPLPVFRLSDS